MKFLKRIENNKISTYSEYITESIKFKLNPDLDNILNQIPNKKKAQTVESFLVKSILTDFYNFIKNETDRPIDKNYSTWNTQQKLDYFLNNSDEFLKNSFQVHIQRRYNQKLSSIIDYINTNNINSNNFEDLYQKSVQWHEDITKNANQDRNDSKVIRTDETENTDKFIEYPNGWYWINLNTSYSADEAKNMSHCGNDSGKILFSLRDENSNSHITVSYAENEKAMYQCKGRGNSKPKQIYHQYILDLLLNETYPINITITGSYKPELDFNLMDLTEEQRDDLINKKPTLEYTDNMFELYLENGDWNKVCAMILNGFIYEGEKKCTDFNLLRFIVNQKLDKSMFIHDDWFNPDLDLNTTKEDLEFYIEHYNKGVLDSKLANQIYVLWKLGAISNSDAESKLPDLKIQDGKWFIKYKADNYSEFHFMYSDEGMDSNSISYREFIKSLDDNDNFGYIDYKLSDCDLDDLTTDTKKSILDKMKDGLSNLDESDIEELMNSENFDFESVEEYSVDKVVDSVMDEKLGGDCLKTLLELDTFDDIKNNIIRGYERAQDAADSSEAFNTAIEPLKDFFNLDRDKWFVWSSVKDKDGKDNSVLLLPFDPAWAMLLNRASDNGYYLQSLSRILEEIFDSNTRDDAYLFGIEEDEFPNYLDFNYPYYGFSGSVNKDDLNVSVIEEL